LSTTKQKIRVGHSPDPDDAFMFHALANDKIDSGNYHFTHELVDIETLNHRAKQGDLELTAISIHAYAYLFDKYIICPCGASMGDNYGPMVITKSEMTLEEVKKQTIAIPGTLTSAYLALRLCLDTDFEYIVVPFDEIINAVEAGEYEGKKIGAGLIIHEGQLTYQTQGCYLVVDLGVWWHDLTDGLPLPLGANAIRRDLGETIIKEVNQYLFNSIAYGLDHRQEALDHALQYGRDLDRGMADEFVGMYVNDWTLDFGEKGRKAVQLLLDKGYEAGVISNKVEAEFVDA
jgi:1,4-dihydroxy-6-naphthoate synthase